MMKEQQRGTFSSWLTRLLSEGQAVFTLEQAQAALEIGKGAFLDAAERVQRRGQLISPRRGFYVIVPPQFLAWGAPPPSWYIDSLMCHEGRPYYVGLLKAAELHGAAHHAVMEFQVVTDKRLPHIRAGRSMIVFYYRKDMDALSQGMEDRKTDTGRMKISCVELTLFDLLRYPHAAGGLDNIATVLADLGRQADPSRLRLLSAHFERTVIQRLGYLLSRLGHGDRTGALFEALHSYRTVPWIELEPARASDPDFAREPVERDERWRVVIRRVPEPET